MPKVALHRSGIPQLTPMLNRSPGIHVSNVINDICSRMLGHYKSENRKPSELEMTRMEFGNNFEAMVIQREMIANPDKYVIPGELTVDGIHLTPDAIQLKDYVNESDVKEFLKSMTATSVFSSFSKSVDEVKLTWMNAIEEPLGNKFFKYEMQLKSYCNAVKSKVGFLHVGNVNGKYEFGKFGLPVYNVWKYEFTQDEIDANWAMILVHSRSEVFQEVLRNKVEW